MNGLSDWEGLVPARMQTPLAAALGPRYPTDVPCTEDTELCTTSVAMSAATQGTEFIYWTAFQTPDKGSGRGSRALWEDGDCRE